jgi:hypothetical protein
VDVLEHMMFLNGIRAERGGMPRELEIEFARDLSQVAMAYDRVVSAYNSDLPPKKWTGLSCF